MSATTGNSISLSSRHASGAALTKEQQTFNLLIEQISKRREQLAAWSLLVPQYQKAYAEELVPLQSRVDRLSRELIVKLDEHASHEKLSASERQTMSKLLLGLLENFPDIGGDDALKRIFNRHASTDYDEEIALGVADMKADLEQMFGESFGDDIDMRSSEALLKRAREKMAVHQAREAAKEQAREERKAARAKNKKRPDATTLGHQEKLRAELTQSLRDIYRKLASALHPDREADPQRRQHKTELMQSLNQAYAKQDLLHMLELQMQLQQIDQHALNDIGTERLEQYNRLLQEQIAELDREIAQEETQFARSYGISPARRVTPGTALQSLELQIREAQRSVAAIEENLKRVTDIKSLKNWLKEEKKRLKELEFEWELQLERNY
ncbi:molecular chaperone DnaJ [Herbaspirillum sp.]|uniref:molecular chaperone DnaJ n=1 Tax=Herbaspirillum sp. TaxID=1890675 RepID=UPI001B107EB0|nr:molecular chaperone DnaJ [Herbaspirillum sp.]MBO9536145.1 molecular chaperone DnaJ [Herbaspirillum sp.]